MNVNQRTEHLDQFLKIVEVAEILNISRAFAYKLIQRGELRCVNIGKARRVRITDLNEYILNNLTLIQPN